MKPILRFRTEAKSNCHDDKKTRRPFRLRVGQNKSEDQPPLLPMASTGQPSMASLQSASSSGVAGCLKT